MDEDSKELIKAAAEVVLGPVSKVVDDAVGVLGGDRLGEYRKYNRARWKAHYEHERANVIEETKEPDLRMAAEILGEAQDEFRDELLKIWAKLMAALVDSKRAQGCRREFVDIVKQLEPLDAAVLMWLSDPSRMTPSRKTVIASRLQAPEDHVELSFRNLLRLELVWQGSPPHHDAHPVVTVLGRQLLAAIR